MRRGVDVLCGSQVTDERLQLTIRTTFLVELPSNRRGFSRESDLLSLDTTKLCPKPSHGGSGEEVLQLEVRSVP